jgi:hypothetical protein
VVAMSVMQAVITWIANGLIAGGLIAPVSIKRKKE